MKHIKKHNTEGKVIISIPGKGGGPETPHILSERKVWDILSSFIAVTNNHTRTQSFSDGVSIQKEYGNPIKSTIPTIKWSEKEHMYGSISEIGKIDKWAIFETSYNGMDRDEDKKYILSVRLPGLMDRFYFPDAAQAKEKAVYLLEYWIGEISL